MVSVMSRDDIPIKERTMARLNRIAREDASDKAKELLDAVKAKLGLVPNMTLPWSTRMK